MFDPFILKALIAGFGVALITGPLGCFIAWQRLAYFGDTIAHSALLGVVLSLLLQTNINGGVIAVSLLLTLSVVWLQQEKRLASDTLLGITAHGALALGLVILSLSRDITIDLNGLLFGDILAVNTNDIALIYVLAASIIAVLAYHWRNLLRMVLHADIAQVEGVSVAQLKVMLMLIIALAVAVSIKLVGILLMTSLLIIPAAAARYFSRTPTQMAVVAGVIGMLAVSGGLYGSLAFDTPTGPSIILAALTIFLFSYTFRRSA